MGMRNLHIGNLIPRLIKTPTPSRQCVRSVHKKTVTSPVPSPTPFVPDVETFLKLIGRGLSKHASKFPSWDKLFTLNSPELRELGIEPTRQRRYLLQKRENFRRGIYGPGGDLDTVVDGVAQLRVVEVPLEPKTSTGGRGPSAAVDSSATLSPGMRRAIVNLPPDATEYKHDPANPLKRFAQISIHRGSMLKGPFLLPVKGTNGSAALITAQEGMWEDKQGRKLAGGERRRDEVMTNRRREERKANA